MMTAKQDLVIFLIMYLVSALQPCEAGWVASLIQVLLDSAQSRNVWRNTDETDMPWTPKLSNNYLQPNVEHCKDQGICSHVPNYPEDLAKSYLSQLKSRNVTKFALEVSYIDGGNIDYENICSEKEKVLYPQAAKDVNGTWQFILNGNSFQGFVVEICKKTCHEGSYFSEYELKCTQKYVYKKMLYLDIEHNRLKFGNFQVPTCCSCSLLIE